MSKKNKLTIILNEKTKQNKIKELNSNWDRKLEELKNFINQNNNKYPNRQSCDYEECRLAGWVQRQRTVFNHNKLTEQEIALMDAEKKRRLTLLREMGFVFNIIKPWEESFNELKNFINQNNRYPSNGAKDKKEKILGCWVSLQRKQFKNGEITQNEIDMLNKVNKDRYYLLKDMDFVFSVQKLWQDRLEELKLFIKENNRYPSILGTTNEEIKLSSWVNVQRSKFKKGKMTQADLELLDYEWRSKYYALRNMGFIFNAQETKWNEMLLKYKNFKLEEGRNPRQLNKKSNENNLGNWACRQRVQFRDGKLSLIRVKQLQRAKFDFYVNEEQVLMKANAQFFTEADEIYSRI